MGLDKDTYLEAMERGDHHRAAMDDELEAAWKQTGDELAHAYLLIAAGHRDASIGQAGAAVDHFQQAKQRLGKLEDRWEVKALRDHCEQCVEYLGMGKALPGLPSGL